MLPGIAMRNHFLTGPKELNSGIHHPPQILKVSCRGRPELLGQTRIVRIVRGAHNESFGSAPITDIGDYPPLLFGQLVEVTLHVIEKYAERLSADFVYLPNL